ncbi:acetamidase/formamidase family protein [Anaeromicrobium sediminis]|nr:acetamidase/formamidase family protein [Anaeromicrobium sediminis]
MKLSCEQHIFQFSETNKPVLKIHSGTTVEIETLDCFANQIKRAEDKLEAMDWDRVNPATGPVYIEDAMPGDILKVNIKNIEIGDQGVMSTGKDLGVLGDRIEGLQSKLVKIEDNYAIFDDKLRIPLNKMIGVIGVATEGDGINCGTPGIHGGNMDNKMIRENTTLYLPVFVEGALFALGDLHAVMGDGEIGVSGVEVSGKVTVNLEVIKGFTLNNPLIENDDCIATIASKETLDESVYDAVSDMEKLLSSRMDLSSGDMAMLFSAVGNTEICQVVDPLKTARFSMPKWVLEKYGFRLF